jgi:hypothetical protein
MARFNLVTFLGYEFGLGRDFNLIKNLLEGWGHEVRGVNLGLQRQEVTTPVEDADVNIFLEVMNGDIFNRARQNWFVPNQEWYHFEWDHWLPGLSAIMCKTHEAERAFRDHGVPVEKLFHTGFESEDLYDPTIERKRKFLHVAGGSASKNTLAVGYAFAKFFYSPWDKDENHELILVSRDTGHQHQIVDRKNCTYIEKAGVGELRRLMNECMFHIMPSGAEGWGHVIHEGLGCGAVMLTTDFPPMNEFKGIAPELLVNAPSWKPMSIGRIAWVGGLQVKAAVEKAVRLKPERIAEIQAEARAGFLEQRNYFRSRFQELVDNV